MVSGVVLVVFGGLVPGFLLGLLAFRVKSTVVSALRGVHHAVHPPAERDR